MKQLSTLALSLLLYAAPIGAQGVDIMANPLVYGPGDSGVITIMGEPGHFAILFTSLEPGPLVLPIVGTLDVGPGDIDYVVFGALPANGIAQFFCTLDCVVVSDVYLQAVTLTGGPLTLTGKSPQLVLSVDPGIIDDCDDNGIDDDCDTIVDCNGNEIPDSCDIDSGFSMDADGDGIPDECCPAVCSLEARFTFDGPVIALPLLLTIHVVAPGEPSSGDNEIVMLILPGVMMPMSLTSANGALTASNFAFTPSGGFTFDLLYQPATPGDFGASIVLVGELEGHCERMSISSGLSSRCELAVGTTFPSTNEPGEIEILAVDGTCP